MRRIALCATSDTRLATHSPTSQRHCSSSDTQKPQFPLFLLFPLLPNKNYISSQIQTSSLLQTYRKLSSIAYLKVSRLNSPSPSLYSGFTSYCSRLRDNLVNSAFPKDSHSKSSISALPSFTKVVRNYVNLLTSKFQL